MRKFELNDCIDWVKIKLNNHNKDLNGYDWNMLLAILQHLERIKDLEDELGCPLEILLKIMLGKIDKIIVNYGDGGYGSPYPEYASAYVSGLIDNKFKLNGNRWFIETNICDIPLKDYKINWWSKEDLSE